MKVHDFSVSLAWFIQMTLGDPLTLSLWRGKKYDSSGMSTDLYYYWDTRPIPNFVLT